MKFLKNLGIFALLTLLVFSSCRKDKITEDDDIIEPDPAVLVNGSLSGLVTDDSDMPLEDALVSMGTETTLTDENGHFSFQNVEINTKGSLVTAEKNGYYYNAKFVGSRLNKTNHTRIKMIEKVLSGSFQSNSGGTVTTNGGASIDFSPNSIKLESGGTYTGNVNVYATWLDPTANDLAERAPGDLRAFNANDEQVQLTTYGMLGVELESDGGEALNLADGQTATIELPVPAELQGAAPATIPLWHFDESSGYWVEDGTATLQGDKYVGTVTHFSFWNCDDPNYYVYIDGLITDEGGVGIEGLQVKITENSSAVSGWDWTDQDGVYEGWVPKDEDLTITVYDNCGTEIYSAAIGPFATDTSIPEFSVGTSNSTLTISGTLVDCNNDAVTNGYAKVSYSPTAFSILEVDANGSFGNTISICDASEVTVVGYDLENLKQSTAQTYDVSGTNNLDVGNISVCDDLTEYLNYTIGTNEVFIIDPYAFDNADSLGMDGITLGGEMQDSLNINGLQISVDAMSVGTYSPEFISILYSDGNGIVFTLFCDAGVNCDVDITFTTFEDIGGFVIGSFSGTMEDPQGGGTQDVDGTFKIQRE